MTDCYNYDNRDDSIPQSKYVMVHRNITNDIRQTEKEQLANSYGIKNINDEQEWYKIFHEWSDMVVYRHLSPMKTYIFADGFYMRDPLTFELKKIQDRKPRHLPHNNMN